MRRSLLATAAFLLIASPGMAQAPSAQAPSAQAPSAQAPSAQAPSAQAPAAQAPAAQAPAAQAPAAQAPASPAPASPGANTTTGSSNPAVNTTGNAPSSVNASGKAMLVATSALEKGANSFTEGQAKSRIEGAGLQDVTDLKKDDDGIWRGKAMQAGKSVTVGFDYKGNIAAQ